MVDAHVTEVASVDEATTTHIDAEKHAVLATAARDWQFLQLSDHLVHQVIQLTVAARSSHFNRIIIIRNSLQNLNEAKSKNKIKM